MSQSDPHRLPDFSYNYVVSNTVPLQNFFHPEMDNLSWLDVILVFVCFILTSIVYQRHRWNKRLRIRIKALKLSCKKDDIIIGRLNSFLEDCRSKNSAIEMPLRKMDRKCNGIITGIKKDQCNINDLQQQFREFKTRWQGEAAPVIGVPENDLLDNINSIKLRAELVMLKEYIDRELKSVKFVSDYNKTLLDEAIDDIDRVLVSEGL